jgi:hypothetical protein
MDLDMQAADDADLTMSFRQTRLWRVAQELLALLSDMRPASVTDLRAALRQSRLARAAQELFILATVAWIILICLRDGLPSGASHLAGAWFAYTWTTAVVDFVLLPVVPVLAVGIPFVWFVVPEPNYWPVYRIASIIAVVWLIGATVGLWRMQ